MNRNFIFVFILLATLSMVNAVPAIDTTSIINALPVTKHIPITDPLNEAFSPDTATKTVPLADPPPKPSTVFLACPVTPAVAVPTITINPDPPVAGKSSSFTVTGKIDTNITAGFTTLAVGITDLGLKNLASPQLTLFPQNFKAGEQFTITAQTVNFPPQLPPLAFIVEVAIGDPTGDPKNPLKIFTCGFAFEINCSGNGK